MNPLLNTAAQFIACSALILWSGVRLSRYGDVIAEKTGFGGTWVGVILLATVTSLPELVTGASSVLVFDVPDIAAGDALGSCLVNLVILALLDFRHPVPLTARIHQGHVLSAAFGIVALGLAAMAILGGQRTFVVGWVGVHSLFFIAAYVFAVRTIFVFERSRMSQIAEEIAGEIRYGSITLQRAIVYYVGAAALLVGAASLLPGIAEHLSALTGLEQSFVGSLFVAVSTSLPEAVVSAAAMRIGAVDMAAANLFGSNLFNVAVLGLDDLFYTRGSLLLYVTRGHLVTVVAAMTMTAVSIVGLTYRASRKRYQLSWDAVAVVAIYVLALVLLRAVG